jgi:6-phosphogluconolactonase
MPNFAKRINADNAAVGRAAAEEIVALARQCAEKNGSFTIALSGGSTPKLAYSLMAADSLVKQMPWNKTRIFFGDERHVKPDHADSNFKMASEAMLKSVPIPKDNIFPISTEGTVEQASDNFEKILKAQFPNPPGGFPQFDLVLLGIGPDGHTASLFPGTPAPKEMKRWVTTCDPVSANPAIKPPVKRITITSPVIWNARNVFVLATGAEKTPMLDKIFCEAEPQNPPVSRLVRKCTGWVCFFLDAAAAGTAK